MRSSALRVPDDDPRFRMEFAVDRTAPTPTISTIAERFAPEPGGPQDEDPDLRVERLDSFVPGEDDFVPEKRAKRSGRLLAAGLIAGALLPTAILAVLLWQGSIRIGPGENAGPSAGGGQALTAHDEPAAAEIVLTSPDRIEAKAGEEIDFPITIDSTEALPPRSVVAISAMPEGATFSEGRPYGTAGWSLRPDEIGELRLRLPAGRSGSADMRIEFLAADGTKLAESETPLTITAEPVTGLVASAPQDSDDTARVIESEPQPAPRAPVVASEPSAPAPSATTFVTPPAARVPHDGAMALGEATGAASEEWVEVVRPVDVHAKALQTSETVRVVPKGLKLRVAGRDQNWVQVSDPASSESGWIYNRFLKPTDPPAQ